MSATQAPPPTAEAPEQLSQQADKSSITTTIPNHTPEPSNSQEPVVQPSIDKSSDKGKQNGSPTSGHQSAKAETKSRATTANAAGSSSGTARPEKKRQKGGLLSFLNCCGGSRDPEEIDLQEHPVPSQRPNKTQATQQVPGKTQDISAAESSTAESKSNVTEKIGGTPYAELKSAGEPRIQEQTKSVPAAPSKDTNPATGDEKSGSGLNQLGDSVVGLSPKTDDAPRDLKSTTTMGGDATSNLPAEADTVINDRTPQQEKIDTDIEMTDAPPTEHQPVEDSRDAEASKTDISPPLPPPPSTAPPQHETPDAQTDTSIANQVSGPSEQQKWLLPPIKPEHKGRKCLVLDLDETLVHSSFKVRLPILLA